jgi:hypothetical protein
MGDFSFWRTTGFRFRERLKGRKKLRSGGFITGKGNAKR